MYSTPSAGSSAKPSNRPRTYVSLPVFRRPSVCTSMPTRNPSLPSASLDSLTGHDPQRLCEVLAARSRALAVAAPRTRDGEHRVEDGPQREPERRDRIVAPELETVVVRRVVRAQPLEAAHRHGSGLLAHARPVMVDDRHRRRVDHRVAVAAEPIAQLHILAVHEDGGIEDAIAERGAAKRHARDRKSV